VCTQTSGVGSRTRVTATRLKGIIMAEKNIKKSNGKTAPAKSLKEKRADKKDKATAKANYKEV
jgi:hypothetical protein